MEIRGIGTDIVECPRIGRMIEQHGEQFLRRVFTDHEIRFCQDRTHAIGHFSGRWAAKVALLRALSISRTGGIVWTDMEIRNRADGRPDVRFRGRVRDAVESLGVTELLLSMSHCRTYATASVLAVSSPGKTLNEPPA